MKDLAPGLGLECADGGLNEDGRAEEVTKPEYLRKGGDVAFCQELIIY